MTYFPGDYKAVCFDCGDTHLASELIRHWTGVKKCVQCWEPRHPQDFVSAPPAEQPPPWTQPEPAPYFLEVPVFEETFPPPATNPPPNPGGSNPDPVDPEEPEEPEEPETPPNQSTLWQDENNETLTDEADQPLWD